MGGSALLASVLPTTCPVCGAVGGAPCASCWRRLRPAPAGTVPDGVDRFRALLAYEGVGRELLARLKYRNARSPVPWLAAAMAALVARLVTEVGLDVVTWAPTTPARRRARGFDQAEVLARAVAVELRLPCAPLLRRLPGPAQTGRSRDERWHGPAFVGRSPPRGRPVGVLLVDDLVTTGATISSAALALRGSGAAAVVALTAGRTPRHHDRPATAAVEQGSRSPPPAPTS